ncbi:MAG: hypothetical protein ACR2LE_01390 [Nocardioidaceae bacterium]
MHVGVAKTGTTYLQRILFAHRDVLRSAGLLYPGRRSGDQYVASLDLRGLDDGKFEHLKAAGGGDKIADEVRRYDGNALISHETLARCSTAEIRRVVESCGGELRVVLTVRDLGRQVPTVWQETLKNRAVSSYDEFLQDVFVHTDSGEHKFFWKPQDVSKVVRRWGRQVGPNNVTIVTVPPSGAPRDELWMRFAQAVELPDVPIELPAGASNTSLGPAEAELLRHLNAVLPEDLPWRRYARVVKRQLAEHKLAQRESSRIVVPPQWHDAVRTRAAAMVDFIEGSGCRVVGDLADLNPALQSVAVSGPDDLSRDQLLDVAAEVLRDYVLAPQGRRSRSSAGVADELAVGRLRSWATAVRAATAAGTSAVSRRLARG